MMSPCKGCEDQSAECHGSCGKYAEYRAELDARAEERMIRSQIREARRDGVENAMQRVFLLKKKRGRL